MKSFGIKLFAIVLFTTLISSALGHSYLTKPISRTNQKDSNTGCRGPACLGPCDGPSSNARTPITIARGDPIQANWPRNNHAGGFIRFAWAPTSQSDTHSVFDNNVQQVNCHEVGGCHPDDPNNPDGGDSGPSDGSSRACSSNFTVPLDLTDGLWTMQWAWFGGAFALGDYYSCVDYRITGGPSGASVDPIYIGGDWTYPGQNKCKFFNTNQLHKCINEPCNNPIFPSGDQSGPVAGINAAPSPATTHAAVQTPITSGRRTQTVATSGRQTPVSTGRQTPLSTGNKPATPNPPSTSGQAASNNSCTGGQQRCSDNTHYQICLNGAYIDPQPCQDGLVCQQSKSTGAIYCTLPGQVIRDVNGASSIANFSLWIALAFLVISLTL